MATVFGHSRVRVVKNTADAHWAIQSMAGDTVCVVSFWWAFNALQTESDDYYNAIYTALSYEPLNDIDRTEIARRWPSLRNADELQVVIDVVEEVNYSKPKSKKETKTPLKLTGKRKID